jgi:alpha-1,2-mannosyltransferase
MGGLAIDAGSPQAEGPAIVRMARAALLLLAVLAPTVFIGLTLAVAGDTLGYDFRAYHQAAVRVLHGKALYDTSFQAAGGFGLFYYPPFFAPLVLPLGFLPELAATWLWIFGLIAAFLAGTSLLPVSSRVKWLVLLLGGLSWPLVYALKLGQVGPLLYLMFAIGWRWLDDPIRLGGSAGLGAAIKLQPGLVLVWALLSGRWRAAVWGALVLAVLGVLATVLAGPRAWGDFLALLRQVADPITTPHNFTPGAVAYQLGVPAALASVIQVVTTLVALALVIWAARDAAPDAGYLVAVVASQLVSPILWDHYAMLLLLPVAWLLERRQWWAAVIPLATPILLVGITPPFVYPLAFVITVLAVAWLGRLPASLDRAPKSLRGMLGAGR